MTQARTFISHTHEDKLFVRCLVEDLGNAGVNVWLDEQELKVGDSIIEGISSGLTDSDYLIVVLSCASSASNWVRAELNAALMDQLSSGGTVVLPALIEDCDLPVLLQDRVYADFRVDYQTGLSALLEVLAQETKPQTPRLRGQGCIGSLRSLAPADLRRRLEKHLSRDNLRVVWHATLDTDMEDDMRNSKLQICALELILQCQRRELMTSLYQNLCIDFPHIARA